MGFTTLGLNDRIIKGVHAAGYTVPTPIQSMAIQPALEGRDIIGCAQTGTGKTAAFVLPVLQRLMSEEESNPKSRAIRALVVTPTRELAHQVNEAVTTYGKFINLRSVCIYGGVGMENQLHRLRRGADIVIATPGRLLDHMERGSISLKEIRILVLDEADRMLDMGFINDVRRIIKATPAERQTMLFSATISKEITDLASSILRNPHSVEVGEKRNPAETIKQHFYSINQESKADLLLHMIEAEKMQSVLVFSRTKHGADKICKRLDRSGIKAAAIHSNRSQSQRQRSLDGFKEGKFRVLVATDIAARGIDVDGISHVINYDIPHDAESYIHRIGRTGRAGANGTSCTFVSRDERHHLKRIEHFTRTQVELEPFPGFVPRKREAHSMPDKPARHKPGFPIAKRAFGEKKGHGKKNSFGKKKRRSGSVVFSTTPRKRKGNPSQKIDSFSSDHSWSNY